MGTTAKRTKELLEHLDRAVSCSDYRRALEGAAEVRAWLDHDLPVIVRGARKDGMSWQEIGDMLGMSRQAAQQRFHI